MGRRGRSGVVGIPPAVSIAELSAMDDEVSALAWLSAFGIGAGGAPRTPTLARVAGTWDAP
jgi:hypothetical protein